MWDFILIGIAIAIGSLVIEVFRKREPKKPLKFNISGKFMIIKPGEEEPPQPRVKVWETKSKLLK